MGGKWCKYNGARSLSPVRPEINIFFLKINLPLVDHVASLLSKNSLFSRITI